MSNVTQSENQTRQTAFFKRNRTKTHGFQNEIPDEGSKLRKNI